MAKLTEAQLRERMVVRRGSWYGHYEVEITYRGKKYTCTSTNSLAWDMNDWNPGEPRAWYSSARQALQAFYDECKRKNGLR